MRLSPNYCGHLFDYGVMMVTYVQLLYQYDNGAQSLLSQFVEVLREAREGDVIDRKHFVMLVVVDVGILNVLQHKLTDKTVSD